MDTLFTSQEMEQHRMIEEGLVKESRNNPNQLFEFWKSKRELLNRRAFDNFVDSKQ